MTTSREIFPQVWESLVLRYAIERIERVMETDVVQGADRARLKEACGLITRVVANLEKEGEDA